LQTPFLQKFNAREPKILAQGPCIILGEAEVK